MHDDNSILKISDHGGHKSSGVSRIGEVNQERIQIQLQSQELNTTALEYQIQIQIQIHLQRAEALANIFTYSKQYLIISLKNYLGREKKV